MDSTGDPSQEEEDYDVFISYCKADSEWVTDTLIQKLEEEGFKVCWDDQNFEPGVSKLDNKISALQHSKKTIVVFSPGYIEQENVWDEIQNGYQSRLSFQSLHIIPIMYEKCTIPSLFEDLWMLDWSKLAARKFFWNKLIKCLKTTAKHGGGPNHGSSKEQEDSIKKAKLKSQKETTALVTSVPRDSPSPSFQNEAAATKNVQTSRDLKDDHVKDDLLANGYRILATNQNPQPSDRGNGQVHNKRKNRTPKMLDSETAFSPGKRSADEEVKHLFQERNQRVIKSETADCSGSEDGKSENEPADQSAFESYRRNLSPRLLGNFLPEDDDLSKDDVDKLTFKIEEVYAKGLLGDHEAFEPVKESDNLDDNANCKIPSGLRSNHISKFASAQEQMRVLDSLQDWQEKIKSKFERCRDPGRKRVYRRLLERFNEAVEKTVNGAHDEPLLRCLPQQCFHTLKTQEFVQCCCCDKIFHSDRALEMHIKKCVDVTWMDLMKHPLKSVK